MAKKIQPKHRSPNGEMAREISGEYEARDYLSAVEAAQILSVSVRDLHRIARSGRLPVQVSPSGQMRFRLTDLLDARKKIPLRRTAKAAGQSLLAGGSWSHGDLQVLCRDARDLSILQSESIHIALTSPPYFNIKLYAEKPTRGDLGNIHNIEDWFSEIGKVWSECLRVLQPGRRLFINIMNLPVREQHGYRTLNLVGKTVDLCERLGFIFKRDVIWHKTNGVRAHFGTYPDPGGILINCMHEYILEFEKPAPRGLKKYAHVTREQREASKLDKGFWLLLKNTDVWRMNPVGSGDQRPHAAPFPIELPYRLIKAFSFVGETVLDPFVGSGTTLVACQRLYRKGIGVEINPDLASIAVESVQAETARGGELLFAEKEH
ncbi:MAG: DNA methyltransferase [Terriglobia bacterium]